LHFLSSSASPALGQGEEARQAFPKSLAIRERLAQAEPGRADYQRDLIVSWVRMSEIEPARAREHLSRALAIAQALRSRTTGARRCVDGG
jgi:hypothetical protein